MKKITICEQEYDIDCNALTSIKYRKLFNRGPREDLGVLKLFLEKQTLIATKLKSENPNIDDETIIKSLSGLIMDDIDIFVEAATRMAYVFILTANPKMQEYEDWLKTIPRIKTNDKWIVEVAEFAADCFC